MMGRWQAAGILAASVIAILLITSYLPAKESIVQGPRWRLAAIWSGSGYFFVSENTDGFENIYIMKHGSGYDKNSWLGQYAGNTNYCLDVITGPGQTVDIPYETPFDVVPAVRADAIDLDGDPPAYASKENVKVELQWTSGFSWHDNSTDLIEYVFENSGYGTTTGYVRINAVFDNNGTGWKLPASSYAGFTVSLWVWG
ncbi:MAG: hypothetical protein QXG38_01300 [Candidatus Hadarchaeales archaeon]